MLFYRDYSVIRRDLVVTDRFFYCVSGYVAVVLQQIKNVRV